ncbi:P-loop containing nucleoside triphosphate hydrolase protein [Butyriboletus roseoflavus]|nr:P-loop containing nucleoside triphosphate hydrolase protein [Butyriboletus roseoflavus]
MDVPAGTASRSRFRRRRYSVYDLTYEDTISPTLTLRIYSLLDWFRAIYKMTPYVRRHFWDTIKLAPAEFIAYIVTTIWEGVYSAINLYWLSTLFERLGDSYINGTLSPEVYRSLATSWAACALINVAARRIHARSLEVITQRFRAHFIPQFICASLRLDLLSIQDLHSIFPLPGRFGSVFPGGTFLMQLCWSVKCTLDLTSQVFVLLHAISCKRTPERQVLLCSCVARGLVWWLAPLDGIGCSAYIYWPNNLHFQKMKSLFGLAFSIGYRADIMLDGIASSIETEYKKSAERLGDIEVLEPTPWCTELLRNWYWDFLTRITLDLPMAIYVLIPATYLSPLSIATMALLQEATKSVSSSIGKYTRDATPSLLEICRQAKRFYNAVDYQSAMPQGTEPFPRPIDRSYDAGMKISFRHVSLRYPKRDRDALHTVSFDIRPGELVLVVGTNGSGKSSMVKLLARLFDPTAGDILIDDLPLVRYDMDQLRAAMVFQSQSPVVYPVTVRENIAFSLPHKSNVEREHVEEAARMGNCSEWISKLSDGYDTWLQPSFDINHEWIDDMYGYPSEALREELTRHKGRLVSISGGEKQRLATARTFMRVNNRTTRLVVVDEAMSALDPVAERDILSEFHKVRTGKTIVCVTHRFYHLAHEADRILCMKDGRVVENGTHAELLGVNGDYAALYHAQAEWTTDRPPL